MKIYSVKNLVDQSFNVVFINALQQFWLTTKSFQCFGKPKKQNLFLCLNGCKITYTDKNGSAVTAESGDVVYTPIGSEYKAQLFDFQNASSHTVGINFFIYDEDGKDIILSNDIQIFRTSQNQKLPLLFQKMLKQDMAGTLTRKRILLMEILCALSEQTPERFVPQNISKAVEHLSRHVEEAPTVAELAKLSNISEVYFRKQFKAYMGATPVEYRNALRLEKARSYLEYGEISVQEISDMLGYSTVSHFIKEFKKHYGCSPLKYRIISKKR